MVLSASDKVTSTENLWKRVQPGKNATEKAPPRDRQRCAWCRGGEEGGGGSTTTIGGIENGVCCTARQYLELALHSVKITTTREKKQQRENWRWATRTMLDSQRKAGSEVSKAKVCTALLSRRCDDGYSACCGNAKVPLGVSRQ